MIEDVVLCGDEKSNVSGEKKVLLLGMGAADTIYTHSTNKPLLERFYSVPLQPISPWHALQSRATKAPVAKGAVPVPAASKSTRRFPMGLPYDGGIPPSPIETRASSECVWEACVRCGPTSAASVARQTRTRYL